MLVLEWFTHFLDSKTTWAQRARGQSHCNGLPLLWKTCHSVDAWRLSKKDQVETWAKDQEYFPHKVEHYHKLEIDTIIKGRRIIWSICSCPWHYQKDFGSWRAVLQTSNLIGRKTVRKWNIPSVQITIYIKAEAGCKAKVESGAKNNVNVCSWRVTREHKW